MAGSLIECRKLLGQGQVDKDDPTSGIWMRMITAPKEEEEIPRTDWVLFA